jgi:hypothetical protein
MTRPSSATMARNLGEMRYPTICCFLMGRLPSVAHGLIRRLPDATSALLVLLRKDSGANADFPLSQTAKR